MRVATDRTFHQAHLDAEQADLVTRWRAVQTVRSNVTGLEAQDEVLATLGLVDVVRPDLT